MPVKVFDHYKKGSCRTGPWNYTTGGHDRLFSKQQGPFTLCALPDTSSFPEVVPADFVGHTSVFELMDGERLKDRHANDVVKFRIY